MTPDALPGTATAGTPQATTPQIPALPSAPGAPTAPPAPPAGTKIVIVDQQPVIAGGQGGGIAGTTATTQPPDFPFDPNIAIETALRGAIPLFGIMLGMLAILFIGFPLTRAFVRRLDKRAEQGMIKASDVLPQIRQLQESVDAMAVELERISEAQRFQAKLMADRPGAVLPPHEGPRA